MTTQQQTERDEALIAEAERLAQQGFDERDDIAKSHARDTALHALRLAREGWTPPAKPDRYVVIAEEITSAANIVSHGGYYELDIEAADAVLRKHFEPSAEAKAMLETFSADVVDAQSRYVIVHQLRASADIQDRETKRKTGWADTNDRACLMRSAADAIEALADFILKGDQ